MSVLTSCCSIQFVPEEDFRNYDAVVFVSTGFDAELTNRRLKQAIPSLQQYKEVDEAIDSEVCVINLPPEVFPVRRLIYSSCASLDQDYVDVRSYYDAACKGIQRSLKAGAKNPLLIVPEISSGFERHALVTVLGALEPLYVPLEIREDVPDRARKVDGLGVSFSTPIDEQQKVVELAHAIERGRYVCRDIGGSDPERMAPPNVQVYVQQLFSGTCVKVNVIDDEAVIRSEYPLLAAVNRAARGIERHRARIIYLTYEPDGPIDTTLVLVGKGVTYDTGGADVKAGGVMAGMHRDKCGAAAVAGFFQVLADLKPKGIRVLGGMSMVRNSIGPDGYVSDELITSRAGVRLRVGNTDAEGRMAMADVLSHLKDQVGDGTNSYLFTIATLTGHACLTVGDGYSVVLDNGPAKSERVGASLQQSGELVGDMFEISTIRREDFQFHKGKSEYEDLLQCNNLPSSRTARGHQGPAAFLIMASGLDKHGLRSAKPLKYCHIDIAASSGPFPGIPSGAPIAALTSRFIFDRL